MEKFDLERALKSQPVKLRDGNKAIITSRIPEKYANKNQLMGFIVDENNEQERLVSWLISGKWTDRMEQSDFDIIGMWEDPRPRVQLDLPAPLEKVENGQKVYFLDLGNNFYPIKSVEFNVNAPALFELYKNGGLFEKEEHAKEWLEAMQNSRR